MRNANVTKLNAPKRVRYAFRLFVAGDAQNSALALANLTEICVTELAGLYTIEVIDVFRDSRRALEDGIFMTPTLVRLSPSPIKRIVGTLSDKATVTQALGLHSI